jgi:zinc protease
LSAETTARELDGGVRLLLEPSTALPIVSIVVALRSGSAHDPAGLEGLTRITARMLRRGCDGMDALALEAAIDRLGGEVGADVSTSSCAVSAHVLSRNLEPFVELLAKLIGAPTFDEKELGRLLRETRAELLESLDNDRGLADRFFRRKLFEGHGYGRTARGTARSLDGIDRARVVAHHAKHFVKGNVVVAMSGDVSAEVAEAMARKLVERLPDGPALPDVLTEPPPPSGRSLVFVDKPDRSQTQILIGSLGTSAHDADHTDLTIGNAIFGGTFTSRLTREVRGKRGWSYGASSRMGVDRHRHSFVMWTFPAANDAAACIALELELLAKLVDRGVTDREVRFIQRFLTRSWAFEVDTAQKRVHHALDVELLGLPKDYYSGHLARLATVTAESASAALRARLHPQDLVVAVVGTESQLLAAVQSAIPDLGSTDVVAHDVEARATS